MGSFRLSAQNLSSCFSILLASHWPSVPCFRYPKKDQMSQDTCQGTTDLRPSLQSVGDGEVFGCLNSNVVGVHMKTPSGLQLALQEAVDIVQVLFYICCSGANTHTSKLRGFKWY